jgi:hypothetical protein
VVSYLIEKGGNVNDNRTDGWTGIKKITFYFFYKTALHYAANFGKTDIARILLDKGALVDPIMDISLSSPLHFAANKVQLIIHSGLFNHSSTGSHRNHTVITRKGCEPRFEKIKRTHSVV